MDSRYILRFGPLMKTIVALVRRRRTFVLLWRLPLGIAPLCELSSVFLFLSFQLSSHHSVGKCTTPYISIVLFLLDTHEAWCGCRAKVMRPMMRSRCFHVVLYTFLYDLTTHCLSCRVLTNTDRYRRIDCKRAKKPRQTMSI